MTIGLRTGEIPRSAGYPAHRDFHFEASLATFVEHLGTHMLILQVKKKGTQQSSPGALGDGTAGVTKLSLFTPRSSSWMITNRSIPTLSASTAVCGTQKRASIYEYAPDCEHSRPAFRSVALP